MGKIIEIETDGLLIIDIPNRSTPWQADPSDMERVENFKVLFSINLILKKALANIISEIPNP